jgi:tRNA modification GTPase
MPQEWRPASSQKQKHVDPAGYLSTKTIAALCSPTGGAICVLRISGEQAFSITQKLTDLEVSPSLEKKAKRVWVRDESGKKIDDAVMVAFFGPRSFTGEDVVEFFLHGSPIIAQKVLDTIFSLGARLALPGEFSFRAVKNGKMMLSQAEAVKELIAAENDFALELAIEKLSGSQHALVDKIRTDLLQLVTLSEVGIDFSDQDIDEVSLPRLKIRIQQIAQMLQELRGSFDRGKRFLDGIPVSVFGLPNAGKSSFFNALLGEDRSIVSDIAGTTRDVIREKLNLRGKNGYVTFKLSDTAGLRKLAPAHQDQIEEIGMQRSIQAARDSDLVLVVIDGVSPNLAEIWQFLKQIDFTKKAVLGIVTKKDLLGEAAAQSFLNELMNGAEKIEAVSAWTFVSSKTLDGIHQVAEHMADQADHFLSRKPGEVVLTQFEHVQAVGRSLECLDRALSSFDLVLFATDIRHAMNELGPLIGETIPDDVLGKIFSDFCIGK